MHRFLTGFAIIWLASCSPKIETRLVLPVVPEPLRQPCLPVERTAETLADVALILTDQVEALDCANDKIVSVDEILDRAEAQVKGEK